LTNRKPCSLIDPIGPWHDRNFVARQGPILLARDGPMAKGRNMPALKWKCFPIIL